LLVAEILQLHCMRRGEGVAGICIGRVITMFCRLSVGARVEVHAASIRIQMKQMMLCRRRAAAVHSGVGAAQPVYPAAPGDAALLAAHRAAL